MFENLSQSDIIAIVIFLLSSLISIYLYKKVKQTKFIFLEKEHLNFNNFNFKNIKNLELVYKNEKIDDFLVYLNGTIIMVGDHDIKPEDIYVPITLKIKDKGGKWKYLNIEKKTELLNYELIIENNFAKIKTDIIKKNDFITFTGFYNSQKIGYSIIHRILNANKVVHIIYEKYFYNYIIGLVTSLICIILFSSTIIKSQPNTILLQGVENSKTIITGEKRKLSKKDSILLKSFKYDALYFINNDTLKYDSIFQNNYELNKKINRLKKANHDSLIDIMFKSKSQNNNTSLQKLNYTLNHRYKDSLFFEDIYSIKNKKDSLIINLLSVNKLKEKVKYRLNDSISVSFTSPYYYKKERKQDTFGDFIFNLFPYLMIILFSLVLLYCSYNIYFLKKLSKIYK
ncbi:hypothetical protein [Elizabethkingia ursingii]|uniref:hypothetical protein n=1 Tax=Elizabethkingia ursingii TaxID=1756150 RepID=UPI002010CD8B|nr:hypothetical protein [Elizabethkingia ursingii]MCL1672048.1 hypothetical protein [Elizabethkingia ursingii]